MLLFFFFYLLKELCVIFYLIGNFKGYMSKHMESTCNGFWPIVIAKININASNSNSVAKTIST